MIIDPKRYTITAALPYANGPLHFGHIAGCYLPADIYARYLRSAGKDVIFVGGSDEHGVPITIKAKKVGITPQQVVDKYHGMMKSAFEEFGISFDIYSRTSNAVHHQTASDFFKTLYDKGVFTEEVTEQYYDEEAKQFLADRYITGTCPKCSNDRAYGDQCENCGSTLNPTDLINPVSTLSGNKPVLKQTKNWYLPLDKIEGDLRTYIESHPEWKSNVYGQCMSWINEGLKPRAMTRDLDWGVKVPVEGAEGKVLYVWFDAPIGYISATKELKGSQWEPYWKSEDTKLVHFIGKDNIVFHCLIFPAMLHVHGGYILPDNVPANEFLNLEGEKFSTSRNWAAWLHEYLQDNPGKQDYLRYTLCSNAPETKDNDFTWKDFQARCNNELLAVFGNFVNRTLVLTEKYYNNVVPAPNAQTDIDNELLTSIFHAKPAIEACIEKFKFREALSEVMNLARAGNKYLADTEPWKLIKTDPERVATILYNSLQVCASLAIYFEPFLPFTSKKMFDMLNLKPFDFTHPLGIDIITAGHTINKAELLFERVEDEFVQAQVEKLKASAKQNESKAVEPQKEETTYDDFVKMDLRVGTILEAERVPKTDKLLKLLIDTGIDKRTVVSGIAGSYAPENIIGQQVTILANLAPRKIKGIESKGMILMAENADGSLAFVAPDKAIINGGKVS
jgi:methionyl-tRNA synthetase